MAAYGTQQIFLPLFSNCVSFSRFQLCSLASCFKDNLQHSHVTTNQITQSLFLRRTFNCEKSSSKERMTMKKQFLIILMITSVLATVFVAGCTRGITNTTSTSPATSTASITSKITATTIPSAVPRPKATAVPTATPSKTPTKTPTAHAAGCNFIGDSSTHVFYSARCPCVSKIKPEHRVCFDTAQQAIAAGYRS